MVKALLWDADLSEATAVLTVQVSLSVLDPIMA